MEEGTGASLEYLVWVCDGLSTAKLRWPRLRMRWLQWVMLVNSLKEKGKLISALGLDPKDIPEYELTTGPTPLTLLTLRAGYLMKKPLRSGF